MSAVLRHVLLLQKDVQKAAKFYKEGLGLPVNVLTERWAELQAGDAKIALKAVDGCACMSLCTQNQGSMQKTYLILGFQHHL